MPDWKLVRITEVDQVEDVGHLVTYTIGIGNIPLSTTQFMKRNKDKILTVTSTGNRNWGKDFGLAADKISKHYHIPILMKLELAGTAKDVAEFIAKITAFDIGQAIV